jgi:hypothetical protein
MAIAPLIAPFSLNSSSTVASTKQDLNQIPKCCTSTGGVTWAQIWAGTTNTILIADVNYQNNLNGYKQNNNSSKKNNPARKLDFEKLKTELTNTYNQPTTIQ